jgi:thiol-disulfide isomerase/thioredoxin
MLAAVIFAVGCKQGGNPNEAVIPEHIKTMTPAKLQQFIKDNKGKVVVADMWATWCPPCRMEISSFIDIQKTMADKVALVTLCSRQGADGKDMNEDQLKKFMKEYGINYPVYFISSEFFKEPVFASQDGSYAFPTTVFFDKDGKQVDKHVGYATKSYFIKMINKISGEEK